MTSGSKVSDRYEVREVDISLQSDEILRLWALIESDRPPDRKKLDWFYLGNPVGQGCAYLLYFRPEDRPVGVMCVGRRDFYIAEKTMQGVVFADFVIEPGHRSLGPGLVFQKQVLEMALESFDLQYGFPNELSAKLRRFGGYRIEQTLSICVLPLKACHYLARFMPALAAKLIGAAITAPWQLLLRGRSAKHRRGYRINDVNEPFVNQLWQRAKNSRRQYGVRDWAFVHWRIISDPFVQHSLFGCSLTDGTPAAYIAYTVSPEHHVAIVDWLAGDECDFAAALALFVSQQTRSKCLSITVCVSPTQNAFADTLQQFGFHVRGDTPAFIAFKDNRGAVEYGDSIHLNLIDNDT